MNPQFLLILMLAGQPTSRPAEVAWVASGEFCEPETVLALPDRTLLVSNVCDFKTAGTGFLSLLNASGEILDWRIVDALDAPLGMSLVENRLYVVDSNRVRVFRWPGYEPIDVMALETTVANDIVVLSDGTIYITDTAKHQVIQRGANGEQTVLTGEARFQGANGIAWSDGVLYVGGSRLWRVDLSSGDVTTVGPEWLSDIDGIEIEIDGTLQITPVGGPLIRYRGNDDVEILAGPGISSANHGFAPQLGLALIPTGFDNSVIAIRIPTR